MPLFRAEASLYVAADNREEAENGAVETIVDMVHLTEIQTIDDVPEEDRGDMVIQSTSEQKSVEEYLESEADSDNDEDEEEEIESK